MLNIQREDYFTWHVDEPEASSRRNSFTVPKSHFISDQEVVRYFIDSGEHKLSLMITDVTDMCRMYIDIVRLDGDSKYFVVQVDLNCTDLEPFRYEITHDELREMFLLDAIS